MADHDQDQPPAHDDTQPLAGGPVAPQTHPLPHEVGDDHGPVAPAEATTRPGGHPRRLRPLPGGRRAATLAASGVGVLGIGLVGGFALGHATADRAPIDTRLTSDTTGHHAPPGAPGEGGFPDGVDPDGDGDGPPAPPPGGMPGQQDQQQQQDSPGELGQPSAPSSSGSTT